MDTYIKAWLITLILNTVVFVAIKACNITVGWTTAIFIGIACLVLGWVIADE